MTGAADAGASGIPLLVEHGEQSVLSGQKRSHSRSTLEETTSSSSLRRERVQRASRGSSLPLLQRHAAVHASRKAFP